MSIEEQLERGVQALESIAASLKTLAGYGKNVLVADVNPGVGPKPKRPRKKKEATPAPQSEVVATDEPAQSSLIQEEPAPAVEAEPAQSSLIQEEPAPATTAATKDMTPEELDKELMALAVGAAPAVIQKIFAILATVGAKNTRQVPDGSRRKILNEAAQAVEEMNHA